MRSSSGPVGALLVFLLAAASGCGGCTPDPNPPDGDPDPVPLARCEMPLDAFLQSPAASGSGSTVKQITSTGQLIGGPTAIAKPGDWLFANDRIRVIVQGVDRRIGPHPYGATIIDADLVHDGPGNDQLGEIGLLYNFARTIDPVLFDVLRDGSDGGPAILAITGPDIANDYMAVRNHLKGQVGTLPIVDPYADVPLHLTTYYVLQPGEQRLQMHTAFCNVSGAPVTILAGELTDPGEGLEFFNGQSCTFGFGFGGTCMGLDRMSWFGLLGQGVAYGSAPWTPGDSTLPGTANVTMTLAGITVNLAGVAGIDGLQQWFNQGLSKRSGELTIPAGESRVWARDFYVARDLGEVSTLITRDRAGARRSQLGTISGTVSVAGTPLANARVHVAGPSAMATVFTTDAQGRFSGEFQEGAYTLSAWAPGHTPSASQSVQVRSTTPVTSALTLERARQLTVQVRDHLGQPMPGKVTVLCRSGACATPAETLNLYTEVGKDALPAGVQDVRFVPPSGTLTFPLPAGEYNVLVSRGPEYSIHPNTYPAQPGVPVDLRSADRTITATLVKVVDTTGWLSADFHVHAINSPDSSINNLTRVLNFAGEGVDVLVGTDHDVVTDFAPWVAEAGAQDFVSTIVGEEVSTMDFGHYNIFPLVRDPSDPQTGGAVDWAGGRGATLSPRGLMAAARARGARTIHLNHPKSGVGGSFAMMQVDTDTLATHADPLDFRMDPSPLATARDTGLFGSDFNAYEILNAAEDEFVPTHYRPHFNDWFTFLSRGLRVAGTGVSDTHTLTVRGGGYYRTYVKVQSRDPADFDPHEISASLNALRASAGAGPFVVATAARVNAQGAQTSLEVGMGETLPASGDQVELRLRIQAPEYLDVSRIEIYMHQPQDDARCPIPSNHPNALTTRVSCGGASQHNWPASGITRTREVVLTAADLVPVFTSGGITYRRWDLTETFRLPAPTRDNWIVAMVYGSRTLFPLMVLKPGSGDLEPAPGFAFTNPIFIDADGNGYDKPPFNPPAFAGAQSLPEAPGQAGRETLGAPVGQPLTREQLLEGWKEISHTH